MYRIGALLIGYLLGGIQSAIVYGRLKGVDIRSEGSGNAGTTNTIRVMGKKAGVVVLLVDIFKAVLAIYLARLLLGGNSETNILVSLYSGIGAILGHSYPLFFGFKGGKGIATTAGTLIGIDIKLFLIAAVIFLVVFGITKIVSLSSLIMTASIPIFIIIFYAGKGAIGIEATILALVITAFTFYRHKANIKRLINGEESRLVSKK